MDKNLRLKQILLKIALPLIGIFTLIVLLISTLSDETTTKVEDDAKGLSLFSEDELSHTRWLDDVGENVDDLSSDSKVQSNKIDSLEKEIEKLKIMMVDQNSNKNQPKNSTPDQNLYNNFPYPDSSQNSQPNSNDSSKYSEVEKPKIILYRKYSSQADAQSDISNFGKVEKEVIEDINDSLVENRLYVPPTAFTSATMLHGLNAPTSMKRPMPVLLILDDFTFLPNRKELDLKECRLQAEFYGQLSDERAYGITKKLVCINSENQYYSVMTSGYITSTVDNKIGLTGHVVSKQNEMLKRMFLAGAFEGAAEMFKQTSQTIMTSAFGSTTQTTSTDPEQVAKGVLGSGLSTASESAKELYLEKAKNISEVVEVLKQRVEIVFTDEAILNPFNPLSANYGGGKNDKKSVNN